MRSKLSKRLRKAALNISIRVGHPTNELRMVQDTGMIFWRGPRRVYQNLKKVIKYRKWAKL